MLQHGRLNRWEDPEPTEVALTIKMIEESEIIRDGGFDLSIRAFNDLEIQHRYHLRNEFGEKKQWLRSAPTCTNLKNLWRCFLWNRKTGWIPK
jgi:hypothetical protein